MPVWQSLKDTFKAVTAFVEKTMSGPYHPRDDVRESLEALGYRFNYKVIMTARGMPVSFYSITAPSGERIDRSNPDATAQYHKDYRAAVEACDAKTGQQNKPQP